MKQQDAKPLIIREWDRWIQTQAIDPETASARDSFKFLLELQEARSFGFSTKRSGQMADRVRLAGARGTRVELISGAPHNFGRCDKSLALVVLSSSGRRLLLEQRPHEHWQLPPPEKTIDLIRGGSIHRKLESALASTLEACHSGGRYLRNVVA